MNFSVKALAISGFLFASIASAHATPAVTLDNTTGVPLGNPPFTLGWEFSTSSTIAVNGLGVFDSSQDGLVDSYPLAIWDSTGTIVASGTVASGTTDPMINQFRYDSITPVVLAPGDYRIGALFTTGDDPLIGPSFIDATNFQTASGITFEESAYVSGSTLSDPTLTVGTDPGYFGTNFTFSSAAVPEPTSLMLLGSALLGLGALRRRRSS